MKLPRNYSLRNHVYIHLSGCQQMNSGLLNIVLKDYWFMNYMYLIYVWRRTQLPAAVSHLSVLAEIRSHRLPLLSWRNHHYSLRCEFFDPNKGALFP